MTEITTAFYYIICTSTASLLVLCVLQQHQASKAPPVISFLNYWPTSASCVSWNIYMTDHLPRCMKSFPNDTYTTIRFPNPVAQACYIHVSNDSTLTLTTDPLIPSFISSATSVRLARNIIYVYEILCSPAHIVTYIFVTALTHPCQQM